MNDSFYSAFEDLYRGSRDLIRQRARVYVPLLQALVQMDPDPCALDLGCGRGEWLEVLEENGLAAVGVDHDPDMLAKAAERGLTVIENKALDSLRRQPDNSLMLVSAFHLVEHIPFDDLKTLAAQSLRVLKPGGVLIMETPNPENIQVGASEFYLDPTHHRPIPPKLLAFVPRYFKYARTRIVRLRETVNPEDPGDITLMQVLQGVSPDYAVVAQKQADPQVMALADLFFDREYGVSFEAVVSMYDRQVRQRKELETALLHQAEQSAAHARARAETAEKLAARVQNEAAQASAQLAAVYNSLSWRITRPLRWLKSLVIRPGRSVSPGGPSGDTVPPQMPPTAGRIHEELTKALDRQDRERD